MIRILSTSHPSFNSFSVSTPLQGVETMVKARCQRKYTNLSLSGLCMSQLMAPWRRVGESGTVYMCDRGASFLCVQCTLQSKSECTYISLPLKTKAQKRPVLFICFSWPPWLLYIVYIYSSTCSSCRTGLLLATERHSVCIVPVYILQYCRRGFEIYWMFERVEAKS